MEYSKNADGTRNRKYKTCARKAEAELFVTEFNYQQCRNLLSEPTNLTFADVLNMWMDNIVKLNCEASTIHGYSNIINKHMIPYFGQIKLKDLRTHHIQSYYTHLVTEKNLKGSTVHKHQANISCALKYAMDNEMVFRDVSKSAKPPKKQDFEATPYSGELLQNMLKEVSGNKIELPIYIASYLGLRRGEIMGLKWENIDFDKRVLKIIKTRLQVGKNQVYKGPKTKQSERSFVIPDGLYNILIKHKALQEYYKNLLGREYKDTGYVYVKNDGTKYAPNTLTDQFGDFLKRSKLKIIRLHDLRHTFASILHEHGVDLLEISQALGHADIETTIRIYLHLFDKTHVKSMNVMDGLLNRTA